MSTRPVVYFDVAAGNEPVGRIKMELYSDIVPKTAEKWVEVTGTRPTRQLSCSIVLEF